MRPLLPLLALALLGCSSSPRARPDLRGDNADMADPLELTEGADVPVAGCPFSVRTPPSSTPPIFDDSEGASPPRAIHLSWTGDPSNSISVVWATDLDTRGTRVEIAAEGEEARVVTGFTFAYATDLAGTDPPTSRMHEVHVCGLKPGTRYTYRAGAKGQMSTDGTFVTAPAPGGGKPVRFAIAGDTRGGAETWGKVARAASAAGAEFMLFTGDAVYLGVVQEQWDEWFAAAEEPLRSMPLLFAWGNHEVSVRHCPAQFAFPGNEFWYSLGYGDVHFTVLDDTPPSGMTGAIADQAAFADDDLAQTKRKWKVVMHHKAMFSSSSHGSNAGLQAAWMPVFDRRGVDLVANGHDHDIERTRPMRDGKPAPDGKGTTYLVAGGGGADLYAANKSEFTAFSKSTYGFSIVDVAGSQMTVTSYDLNDGAPTQIDKVTIRK